VLVISPPLVAVLLSAERSAGHPLTRGEVEDIVGKSSAIAMEPRDAVALERSRGYADIEPELAWEQWQIVRRTDGGWVGASLHGGAERARRGVDRLEGRRQVTGRLNCPVPSPRSDGEKVRMRGLRLGASRSILGCWRSQPN